MNLEYKKYVCIKETSIDNILIFKVGQKILYNYDLLKIYFPSSTDERDWIKENFKEVI